jgi:glycosyltransferase involved in cell wall biosynthesis
MILYIGNKLSMHGNTPTSVETLGILLSQITDVKTVSDKKGKLARLADMLLSIIKNRKIADFILIDTYSTSNFYYALLCAALARVLHIRYIPILHGGNLPARLIRNPKLSSFLFSHAFMNVAPSEYLYDVLRKHNFAVTYIPNNIEIKRYHFNKRLTVRPKLLYVRAFSKIYNPQMALKVLGKVLEKYPNAQLCMVGPDRDGTLQKTKDICKFMKLEEKVIFTGKMDMQDWWKLSEDYDIFINTTNFDNTPVSLIEAMALGLPVVSTNVGGIPYLIQDRVDGLLVDADDVAAMAEKISYLLENPTEAEHIGINARQKAESFDWATIKSKWIDLLTNKVDGE